MCNHVYYFSPWSLIYIYFIILYVSTSFLFVIDGLLFLLVQHLISSSKLYEIKYIQLYLVVFCAWICLFKGNIPRCSNRWIFYISHYFIYYFVRFQFIKWNFSFYLNIGQLTSIYFSRSGPFGCSIRRLSRHLKSICWLIQKFGGFCCQR